MSWHEDFAKNISRFFSRSKSVEAEPIESESADGSAFTCSVDPDRTPEQHLDTATPPAQASQASDVPDRSCASVREDGGDDGGSALSGSTAPPADGLLRRLGSLLQLGRTERESRRAEDAADAGSGARVEPRTHTQSEERREDDGIDAVNTDAKERSEEKRLHDLACPPVVTYGTYRGLREVRKPKKKHRLELHSPISEGEEAAQPDSYGDSEISAVNTMSSDGQEYPSPAQRIEDTRVPPATESPALPRVGDSHRLLTCSETLPADSTPRAEPRPPKEPANSRQEDLALETASGDADGPSLSGSEHQLKLPTPPERQKPSAPVDGAEPDPQDELDSELDSGLDEEVLRAESQKMVDNILTNAAAALQKMEVCETERDVLLTCERGEGSESGLCDGRSDGGSGAEHKLCVMLSVSLEEALAGSRSPPSSGYESITGSDSDIRGCVGGASDITPTGAPIGSQNQTQGVLEYSGADKTASCQTNSSSVADDEPSSAVHCQKGVLQKTDIKLFLPAGAEESRSQEQHTGDVRIEGGTRSQGSAKENCSLAPNASFASCTPASSGHQEDLRQSQSLSDPLSSLASATADSDTVSELSCQPPAAQSHESEETEARQWGGGEPEQIRCEAGGWSEAEVEGSGARLPPSQWVSVRALRCHVSEDRSPSPEQRLTPELSGNRADTGASPASLSGLRVHLNPLDSRTAAVIPQHPRSHDLDLHQVDGGFAIISEEEESDVVFVNDTGPMLSPSTRRPKPYPFSLSPIFEEDSTREQGSGPELQVPPATEEEQRSVEQPAAAVLSLLQCVSERLRSSVIRESGDESSRGHHSEEDEEVEEVLVIPAEDRPELDAGDAPGRKQPDTLKDVSTPFYQFLKSTLTPSGDGEPGVTDGAASHAGGSTMVVGEMGGFGKVSPRPAAMLICEGGGERSEIRADVEDAGRDLFAHRVTLHALRGCWLLYEDSWYRGSCVLLEEGGTLKASAGAQQNLEERSALGDVLSVGSIRTLLKEADVPEIHLHLSSSQTLRLHAATELTEPHGPVFLSDLCVKTGCWLLCERSGFGGSSALLEADGRLTLLQRSLLSAVQSLRPLQMAGPRVSRPLDPKVLLFQEPQFQGQCWAVLDHKAHLPDMEARVGSLRVTGGMWVGYSSAGFRGHQCVLEEGEYGDCSLLFGGTDLSLQSLRHVQSDFLEPSLCLKVSDQEIGVRLEMADLQETDGICVRSGVWVAYSGRCFSGAPCVLEKGRFAGPLQWGDGTGSARSLRPVHREVCQVEEPKFLLRVYSQTQYGGESRDIHCDAPDCGVPGRSLRVIRGSWLLFDEECYRGNQYILGAGLYPDLTSCGGAWTAIKSVKTLPYSFSEPCVSLFSLSGLQGLEEACGSAQEDVSGLFCQSVRVSSGLWTAHEFPRFRGRQTLLRPGEYPHWGQHSGWDTIGSLEPLPQPKGFLHVRNRALGLVLTAENLPDGSFPAKVFLSACDRRRETQRWICTDGLLKNTAQMGCLSVIGARACVGSRVALWPEHGRESQRWSVTEDGRIGSRLDRRLVLELSGERLVLGPIRTDDEAQIWDIEVL